MKPIAATGGLMLLLAGCSPTQQAFDPSQSVYRGREVVVAPQPGVQPSWLRNDRSPVWPATEAPRQAPLFGNSPPSPYSANGRVLYGSGNPALATAMPHLTKPGTPETASST